MKLKVCFLISIICLGLLVCGCSSSKEKISQDSFLDLTGLEEGDIIEIGHYEQDGDKSNKESIEWIIMDIKSDSALLVSKYVLDKKRYNFGNCESWEKSSLRKWLNNSFYNNAFSEDEKNKIVETELTNYNLQGDEWIEKATTKDKVYILSYQEIKELCKTNGEDEYRPEVFYCQEIMAKSTPYAEELGLSNYTITEDKFNEEYSQDGYDESIIGVESTYWWTRSKYDSSDMVFYVSGGGQVGWPMHAKYKYGIRPAINVRIIKNDTGKGEKWYQAKDYCRKGDFISAAETLEDIDPSDPDYAYVRDFREKFYDDLKNQIYAEVSKQVGSNGCSFAASSLNKYQPLLYKDIKMIDDIKYGLKCFDKSDSSFSGSFYRDEISKSGGKKLEEIARKYCSGSGAQLSNRNIPQGNSLYCCVGESIRELTADGKEWTLLDGIYGLQSICLSEEDWIYYKTDFGELGRVDKYTGESEVLVTGILDISPFYILHDKLYYLDFMQNSATNYSYVIKCLSTENLEVTEIPLPIDKSANIEILACRYKHIILLWEHSIIAYPFSGREDLNDCVKLNKDYEIPYQALYDANRAFECQGDSELWALWRSEENGYLNLHIQSYDLKTFETKVNCTVPLAEAITFSPPVVHLKGFYTEDEKVFGFIRQEQKMLLEICNSTHLDGNYRLVVVDFDSITENDFSYREIISETDTFSNVWVVDNTVYYSVLNGNGIYSVNIDGTEWKEVSYIPQ